MESLQNSNVQKVFNSDTIKDAVRKGQIFTYPVDSIVGKFVFRGSTKSNIPDNISNNAKKTGFLITFSAQYPTFEHVLSVEPSYGRYKCDIKKEYNIGEIKFPYAAKIEVIFNASKCGTDPLDKLIFYLDKECQNVYREICGPSPNWTNFSFDGSVLFYQFHVTSGGAVGGTLGFVFTARPQYDLLADDSEVFNNVKQLLGQSGENLSSSNASVGFSSPGVSFLTALLSQSDVHTLQWTSSVFANLCYHSRIPVGPYDRVVLRASKDESHHESHSITKLKNDHMKISNTLNEFWLDVVTRFISHSDPIVREQGCISMARQIFLKKSKADIISRGTWKLLLKFCESIQSSKSIVDVVASRFAMYVINCLTRERMYRVEMNSAFISLISCANGSDAYVRALAADALFNLAGDSANFGAVKNHIQVFSDMAMKMLSDKVEGARDFTEEYRLQRGASRVLLSLAVDEKVRTGKVTSDTSSALLLLLNQLLKEIEVTTEIVEELISTISTALPSVIAGFIDTFDVAQDIPLTWSQIILVIQELWAFKRSSCHTYIYKEVFRSSSKDIFEGILPLIYLDNDQIQLQAMYAIIDILTANWSIIGAYAIGKLIEHLIDNERWILYHPRHNATFVDLVFRPLLYVFTSDAAAASGPFDIETYAILDFFSIFCSCGNRAVKYNQDVILGLVRPLPGTQTNSICQFAMKHDVNGRLLISSAPSSKSQMWRTIEQFYLYEQRESTKAFLDHSLMLWINLCKENVESTVHFQNILSFNELFNCVMWQRTNLNDAVLVDRCHLFISIMIELYIDTASTDDYPHMRNIADIELISRDHVSKMNYASSKDIDELIVSPTYARYMISMTNIERKLLVGHATQIVTSDMTQSLGPPDSSGGNTKISNLTSMAKQVREGLNTILILSSLDLVEKMILYGIFDDSFTVQFVDETLIAMLHDISETLTESAARVKKKILDILEHCLFFNLRVQIRETSELLIRYFTLHGRSLRYCEIDNLSDEDAKDFVQTFYRMVTGDSDSSAPNIGSIVVEKTNCLSDPVIGRVCSISSEGLVHVLWGNKPIATSVEGVESSYRAPETGSEGIAVDQLKVVQYPRLLHLISSGVNKSARDCVLRNMSLQVEDHFGVARHAMHLTCLQHCGLSIYSSTVKHLNLYLKSDAPIYSEFRKIVSMLRDPSAYCGSMEMAPFLVGVLQRTKYVLENRTVGAKIYIGVEVTRLDITDGVGAEDTQQFGCVDSVQEERLLADNRFLPSFLVSVVWKDGSKSVHSIGGQHDVEIALRYSGESMGTTQSLANFAGLHDAVLEIIRNSHIDKTIQLSDICYSLLETFILENEQNRLAISNAKHLDIYCNEIQNNMRSFSLVHLILSGTLKSNMCHLITISQIKSICSAVNKFLKLSNDGHIDESDTASFGYAKQCLDLLILMFPKATVEQYKPWDDSDVRSFQHRMIAVLKVDLTALNYLWDLLAMKNAEIIDRSFFLRISSSVNLKLIELIGLCCKNNREISIRLVDSLLILRSDNLLRLNRLLNKYIVGFSDRIRMMKPWVVLFNAILPFLNLKLVHGKKKMGVISASRGRKDILKLMDSLHHALLYYEDKARTESKETHSRSKTITAESKHPYDGNTDSWTEICIPGARKIKIAFSSKSCTKAGSDFVRIVQCPPVTIDGCRKYKTKTALLITTEKFPDSTVAPLTILANTVIQVAESTLQRFLMDEVDTNYAPGNYLRGLIEKPILYRGFWVSITPRTVIMLDTTEVEFDRYFFPEKFSGTTWPGPANPLVILSDRFIVCFHSDNDNNEWGWKLSASEYDDSSKISGAKVSKCSIFSKLCELPGRKIFESTHPYLSCADTFETISIPGAPGLLVAFSDSTAMETGYDYLEFFKDCKNQEGNYTEKYYPGICTGTDENKSFFGIDDVEPLYIPADRFVLHFVSDYGGNYFGYEMVVVPCDEEPCPFNNFLKELNTVHISSFSKQFADAESVNAAYEKTGDDDNIEGVKAQLVNIQSYIIPDSDACADKNGIILAFDDRFWLGTELGNKLEIFGSETMNQLSLICTVEDSSLPTVKEPKVLREKAVWIRYSHFEMGHQAHPPDDIRCSSGEHTMEPSAYSSGDYSEGYVCNLCSELKHGVRWFCLSCQDNYCFKCKPAMDQMGYHMAIQPIYLPSDVFQDYMLSGQYIIVESAHPYTEDDCEESNIKEALLPGFEKLAVYFDPRTCINSEVVLNIHNSVYDTVTQSHEPPHDAPLVIEDSCIRFKLVKNPNIPKKKNIDNAVFNANKAWGYRAIVFNASNLQSIIRNDDAGRDNKTTIYRDLAKQKLFPFFENRGTAMKSVYLDFPIRHTGYYEFTFFTESTGDSFIQVGALCCKMTTLPESQAEISSQYCLGIGSVNGSFALHGSSDGASYLWNSGNRQPFTPKTSFKNNVVIGIKIDVETGTVDIFADDHSHEHVLRKSSSSGWNSGLCPAFNFTPGQRVMVNLGQSPFVYDVKVPSVLDSYVATSNNGVCRVWDENWLEWTEASGCDIFEKTSGPAIDSYCALLRSTLKEANVDDATIEVNKESTPDDSTLDILLPVRSASSSTWQVDNLIRLLAFVKTVSPKISAIFCHKENGCSFLEARLNRTNFKYMTEDQVLRAVNTRHLLQESDLLKTTMHAQLVNLELAEIITTSELEDCLESASVQSGFYDVVKQVNTESTFDMMMNLFKKKNGKGDPTGKQPKTVAYTTNIVHADDEEGGIKHLNAPITQFLRHNTSKSMGRSEASGGVAPPTSVPWKKRIEWNAKVHPAVDSSSPDGRQSTVFSSYVNTAKDTSSFYHEIEEDSDDQTSFNDPDIIDEESEFNAELKAHMFMHMISEAISCVDIYSHKSNKASESAERMIEYAIRVATLLPVLVSAFIQGNTDATEGRILNGASNVFIFTNRLFLTLNGKGKEIFFAIQNTLLEFRVMDLAACLIAAEFNMNAQSAGIKLATMMLIFRNESSQEYFCQGQYRKSTDVMTAICNYMLKNIVSMENRPAHDRCIELVQCIDALYLLQNASEGQLKMAQDLINITQSCLDNLPLITPTSDEYSAKRNGNLSLLESMILIFSRALDEVEYLVPGLQEEDAVVIHLFGVIHHSLDSLDEVMQGPHRKNQEVLINSPIFLPNMTRLFKIIETVRENILDVLLRDHPDLFPSLKKCISYSYQYFEHAQTQAALYRNKYWKIYRFLIVVEVSALECMDSLFDVGLWGSTSDATKDLSVKVSSFLQHFDPRDWVNMFRLSWASVVYDPKVHIPSYLASIGKRSRVKNGKAAGKELKEKLGINEDVSNETKDNVVNLSTALIKNNSDSFNIRAMGLDKSRREKKLRAWSMRKDDHYDADLQVTFLIYKISMLFVESYRNNSLTQHTFSGSKALERLVEFWDPKSENAMITMREAYAFEAFFGNVEVKLGKFQLEKIYFPIPRCCRTQKNNPLVKDEMNDLVQNVDRSDPEKKIPNFLDRMLPVKHVIEFQHTLRNELRFKSIYSFMTAHNSSWVFIAFCLSLTINLCLLLYVDKKYDSENDHLPPDIYKYLQIVAIAHFLMSLIICMNYAVGQAVLLVKMGFQWRSLVQDKFISLDMLNSLFGASADLVFQFMVDTIPDWLWGAYFVLYDPRTLYYLLFVGFSCLGRYFSLAFYAFHLLDICTRFSILINVIKSVTMNKSQVVVTFILGAAVIWIYTVIGVFLWGFNVWSYGDSNDYVWQDTLSTVFAQQLDYGLRGPPVFDEYDSYFGWKIFYDTSYQILIIVIMVAIITGIIIDTFGALRENKNFIDADMLNVCFICSLERTVFERNRYAFFSHIYYFCCNFLFLKRSL